MEYYLNINGSQRGPLDIAEFRELVTNKAVSQEDYVWDAKQGRWIKIKFHAELAGVFEEEATAAAVPEEGFFINVEGKTGGPFPRDAITKEIERGRFKGNHFIWDAESNRWLKAAEHAVFAKYLTDSAPPKIAKKYYLSKEGARFGPFEFGEVEEKILNREFNRDHFVWEPQSKKWVKIAEIADFADVFVDLEPPEPEIPPPMPIGEPLAPPPAVGVVTPPEARAPEPKPTGPPEAVAPLEAAPPPAPVGPQPVGPIGRPTVPPPEQYAPEPKVGDLVSISIPPPVTESKPAPPEPAKVSVEEVEFKKVSPEEEGAVPAKADGVKVDRSVVLDFSRPSLVKRFAAQIVDLFFIWVSFFVVALIFGFLDMNPYVPGPDQYYFRQLFWGTIAGVGLFYFLVRDAGGASIGKRVMGLRVVKIDDYESRANLVHSIVRNLTLLFPPTAILDIYYAFADPKGRRVGDRAAGTILVESHEIDYLRHQRTILDEIY